MATEQSSGANPALAVPAESVSPVSALSGFDPGEGDPFTNPNPRQPIFRNHSCWACRDGETPCREGNYNCCSYPHARND